MSVNCIVDTNVILRFILQDHPEHSPSANEFFQQLEREDVIGALLEPVVFEVVFTLQRYYKFPRHEIVDLLNSLLANSGIVFEQQDRFDRVLSLYQQEAGLSIVDCYLAVVAIESGISKVASFDRKIGRVQGVTRFEPPART